MASKLYGVIATIIIVVYLLYCVVLYCIKFGFKMRLMNMIIFKYF